MKISSSERATMATFSAIFRLRGMASVIQKPLCVQHLCNNLNFTLFSKKICTTRPLHNLVQSKSYNLEKDNKLTLRDEAVEIFKCGVSSVNPSAMLGKVLKYNEDESTIDVNGQTYHLDRNVFVVGMGSAALGMAKVVEKVLGKHIVSGVISIPTRLQEDLGISEDR